VLSAREEVGETEIKSERRERERERERERLITSNGKIIDSIIITCGKMTIRLVYNIFFILRFTHTKRLRVSS
jgi:hypothetical protein